MTTQQLTIIDQDLCGSTKTQSFVSISSEKVTVRELIRSRVYQQAKDYNSQLAMFPESVGHFPITQVEAQLNGPISEKRKPVDWQREFEKALRAFKNQQIIVMVDGRQVCDLEKELVLNSGTEIQFLKLTMLMGG